MPLLVGSFRLGSDRDFRASISRTPKAPHQVEQRLSSGRHTRYRLNQEPGLQAGSIRWLVEADEQFQGRSYLVGAVLLPQQPFVSQYR